MSNTLLYYKHLLILISLKYTDGWTSNHLYQILQDIKKIYLDFKHTRYQFNRPFVHSTVIHLVHASTYWHRSTMECNLQTKIAFSTTTNMSMHCLHCQEIRIKNKTKCILSLLWNNLHIHVILKSLLDLKEFKMKMLTCSYMLTSWNIYITVISLQKVS